MVISMTETETARAANKNAGAVAASGSEIPTPTFPDLKGKVAVVVGGSRGIGADLCRRLAESGAQVVVNARHEPAVRAVVDGIRQQGGKAVAGVADCTDPNAVARLRAVTENTFGPADLLALFAGGGGEPASFLDLPLERWDAVIAQNLTTTFLPLREFLRGMVARRSGAIVTMASSAARQPARSSVPYAAAKGAVVTLTRHIAIEVAPTQVRLNCVAPAAIRTERLAQTPEQVRQSLAESFPLRRLGECEDVTHAALFLLSDASSWITGITLDIAGGKVVG